MTDKLQAIREACIKANPEKDWGVGERTDGMWEEKVRLADVLLAIEKEKRKGLVSPNLMRISEFWEVQKILDYWNLRHDDLTLQSPKAVELIHQFLCK